VLPYEGGLFDQPADIIRMMKIVQLGSKGDDDA
jgi:hypothetical protein